MSGLVSSLSNDFSTIKNNFTTSPTGSQPLTANSNVATGYVVTFSGTDELGNPIGPVPTSTSTLIARQGGSGAGTSGIIQAFLPEMFDIGTYAHWQPLSPSSDLSGFLNNFGIPVPNALSGAFALGRILSTGTQLATGYSTQVQALSQMFWVSTDPITFNLNLQLNATADAKTEVTDVVRSLLKLTLPSLESGGTFFRAPGPSLITGGQYSSQYNISMAIGNNWLFPNVLIQQVHATFDVLPTTKGDYISAMVNVVVSTNKIFAKGDLDTAFGVTPTSAASKPGDITTYINKYASATVDFIGKEANQISTHL